MNDAAYTPPGDGDIRRTLPLSQFTHYAATFDTIYIIRYYYF